MLSLLPEDTTQTELQAAVSLIQHDFSRLVTIAVVGEELARLERGSSSSSSDGSGSDDDGDDKHKAKENNNEKLIFFQFLQSNAQWWSLLTSIGVSFNRKLFQSNNKTQRETCLKVTQRVFDRLVFVSLCRLCFKNPYLCLFCCYSFVFVSIDLICVCMNVCVVCDCVYSCVHV